MSNRDPYSDYLLRLERVDNLGAYSIPFGDRPSQCCLSAFLACLCSHCLEAMMESLSSGISSSQKLLTPTSSHLHR